VSSPDPLAVYVVSDATGSTAEAVATSVLVQFGTTRSELVRFPFTRDVEQVRSILDMAAGGRAVIVFTFVTAGLTEAMAAGARERGLTAVDVMSPMMDMVGTVLHHAPQRTPGPLRRQDQELFQVTEAIEYTLEHDDGRGVDTLHQADLVVLGVSRTGKTPTSIYLSCRKLKVANIPIVQDVRLPPQVLRLPVPKVGFRMDLERQLALRAARAGRIRANLPGYSERTAIVAELEYCERVFRSIPGLPVLNVTNRSVEETADWITHHVLG
jgi:regulator of PEP synthase PpsR (kinase-PPPase family)